MLSEKKILNETKNHNSLPPPFKLNGRSLNGLKVNLNKSELIPLAHSKVEIYTHNFSPGIEITTDKFKLLGIIIPTNGKQNDLIEENYYNKKKILEIIKTWQKRDLTLYGKLRIIKSLIIPQLTYALTSLPSPG